MLLKIAKGLFRSGWWLLLAALVIVAVYLSLGRILALSVESNQVQIARFLKDNGFEFVKLGTISGDWQVHDPRFIVKNISVSPLGEPALEIDSLVIRVDSVRSLISQVPIVTELAVSGVRFTVERNATDFWIRGFKRSDGKLNVDYILDSLPHLKVLSVDAVTVDLVGPDAQLQMVSKPGEPWTIHAEDNLKQISLPLYLQKIQPDGVVRSHQVNLSGYYQGDIRKADFVSKLFLEAPHVDLEDFLPQIEIEGQRLSSARLDTKIWLTLEPDNVDVTGEIRLTDICLDDEEVNLLDEISSSFRFQGDSVTSGRLSIPSIRLSQSEFAFELDNINLAIETKPEGTTLAGSLARVDVGEVTRLIAFAGNKQVLPERLTNALASVSPRGELRDLFFLMDLAGGTPRLVSHLADVSMDAYLGVPSINRLNGFISLETDSGYLDIDNDEFEMNFRNMFDSAWPFDSGRGRVAYRVGQNSVTVTSGLIELSHGGLSASGKLVVNLPPDRELQTWGLTIGISDADLLEAGRYIPNTIPEELGAWIDSAVKAGHSNETGLTIHGALFRGAPVVRKAYDLYLQVEETEIEYHPAWPPATDLSATIHINNHHVVSTGATGSVFSSRLEGVDVLVPIPPSGKADTVMVKGEAIGPFSDAIRLLNETPLSETTSQMAAQWSAEGDMKAVLQIEVPIGLRGDEEVQTGVLVTIADASLIMPDFDLKVGELEGGLPTAMRRG